MDIVPKDVAARDNVIKLGKLYGETSYWLFFMGNLYSFLCYKEYISLSVYRSESILL